MAERESFRAALDRHLDAIRRRDLAALAETVDPDEVVLVGSDGEVSTEPARFLELHRAWFETGGWSIDTEPIHTLEASELASSVLRLRYREERPDGVVEEESILTLVFRRRDGRWLLVHDQNTPVGG